jgi:hypothetical protein
VNEQDFLPHYDCYICGERKYRADIKFVDDKPICIKGDCRSKYEKETRPTPRTVGYMDKG